MITGCDKTGSVGVWSTLTGQQVGGKIRGRRRGNDYGMHTLDTPPPTLDSHEPTHQPTNCNQQQLGTRTGRRLARHGTRQDADLRRLGATAADGGERGDGARVLGAGAAGAGAGARGARLRGGGPTVPVVSFEAFFPLYSMCVIEERIELMLPVSLEFLKANGEACSCTKEQRRFSSCNSGGGGSGAQNHTQASAEQNRHKKTLKNGGTDISPIRS
jgi:hypothetical protein